MVSVFGHVLFDGFVASELAFLAVVYFGAFCLKGVFGVGTMPTLVIFGAWVLAPHDAVVLAVLTNAVSQVQFITDMRRDADWKLARPIVLAFVVSLVFGVWIFDRLDAAGLTVVLGLCLGVMVAAESFGLLAVAVRRLEKAVPAPAVLLGTVGGLIAGIAGAGGIVFLSLYVKTKVPGARVLRATMLLMASVVLSWRILVLAAAGFITPSLLMEGAMLLPLAFSGVWLGSRLFPSLDEARFARFFTVILMVGAAALVWRGVAGMAGG